MSIKKKIAIAVGALCIAILLGSFYTLNKQGTKGDKAISIKIINEITKETVYDEQVNSDTQTLEELLKEQTQLKAVVETGTYGGFLTGLMDIAQDANKGPWWLFTSENNVVCKEMGMCPAIDQVTLSDQDAFTFTYTSDIGF